MLRDSLLLDARPGAARTSRARDAARRAGRPDPPTAREPHPILSVDGAGGAGGQIALPCACRLMARVLFLNMFGSIVAGGSYACVVLRVVFGFLLCLILSPPARLFGGILIAGFSVSLIVQRRPPIPGATK